jgi:hypothetical protein
VGGGKFNLAFMHFGDEKRVKGENDGDDDDGA